MILLLDICSSVSRRAFTVENNNHFFFSDSSFKATGLSSALSLRVPAEVMVMSSWQVASPFQLLTAVSLG